MSSSAPIVSQSDEQRWMEWQARGLDRARRQAVTMRWVLAIITIALGAVFGPSCDQGFHPRGTATQRDRGFRC